MKIVNKKRRLLLGGALSTVISGCVTTQQGHGSFLGQISSALGNVLDTLPGNARQRLGYEANQEAARIYAPIYETMMNMVAQTKNARAIYSVPIPVGLVQKTKAEQFLAHVESLPETLSDIQMAKLWPLLVEALGLPARRTKRRHHAASISLRDAAIHKVEYRRRYEANASQNEQIRVLRNVDSVQILPRQTAVVVMKAYCADKTLPAFGAGDLLTLRHIESFVKDERFGKQQIDLLRFAAKNPGVIRTTDLQFILWALQGYSKNGSPYMTKALMRRPDLLSVLETASPGATAALASAVQTAEFERFFASALESVAAPLRSLMGTVQTIEALADPQRAGNIIEQEIQRAIALGQTSERGNLSSIAAYSTLRPGVYAHAEGISSLKARATITNISSDPFEFVPYEWVAETKTERQRGNFTHAEYAEVGTHGSALKEDGSEAFAIAKAGLEKLSEKGFGAPEARPGTQLFDRFGNTMRSIHEWVLREYGELLPGGSIALKLAADIAGFVPIIGNIKSAYDFFFDEDLTPHERLMAGLGAIPVAGNIARAAGSADNIGKIVGKIIEGAQVAAKVTEPLRAIDDVTTLLGDLSEAMGQRIDLGNASRQLISDLLQHAQTATPIHYRRATDIIGGKPVFL